MDDVVPDSPIRGSRQLVGKFIIENDGVVDVPWAVVATHDDELFVDLAYFKSRHEAARCVRRLRAALKSQSEDQ